MGFLKIYSVIVKDYIANLKCDVNILDKLSRKDFHEIVDAADFYPPHLTTRELHYKIKRGTFYQGTFRASRDNFLEGSIMVESFTEAVRTQICINQMK